ncbi:conserved Plasmodium protein, unknown function [Plasmodium relictum]|uniref:MORN repeat protein n=1 Tax=Plasmodium relictum TaxID=85471 RepID=A0A1J1H6E3_PLARL|nr:conserved Plasmodium protein, unknown function [Plasmodium relictum]CRH00518.1 conserved Plasmodium protein, unknown function [Plasmodium relictum]
MNDEIPSNIIKFISYDLIYWKNFFLKKEENEINAVEINSTDSLQLKNVKINNKIYDGIIKLDSYKCPYFSNNFSIYKEGKKYMGDFKKRKLTGYGEILSKSSHYKGYINNGKKYKKGKYIFNNKLMYNGYWKNNKRNGYGVLKFLNEEKKLIYKGYWKNNKRNFYGIQYYNNNSIYIGFWEENNKCGFGKMIWFVNLKKDKNKYVSIYENIKKNEILKEKKDVNFNIKYKKANIVENIYVGEWMNDKQHGLGTYIWFRKKRSKNKVVFQNENYDKYSGYWKEGKKNGYGIFYYNNGNKYIGMWENNKKNGYGYLLKENGILYKCLYRNNELISEKELNPTYKINYIYTNSLCNVIDLFFFKRIYNITNKNIEFFYKIIYKNFQFLVEIYSSYKKGKEKKQKKGIFHSFKLRDLRKMLYISKIINTDFTLNSLNNLIIDYSFLIEENELVNLLDINRNFEFSFNEKDIIEFFFELNDCLNVFSQENILNKKNSFTYKTNEKKENQENVNLFTYNSDNHNKNFNSINTNNDENTNNSNIHNILADEKLVIHDENNLNKNSNYLEQENWNNLKYIFNHIKNIIFNSDLLLLKDCTNFYKYHYRHCCHQNENNFILKKTFFFLLKNKRKNNKHYLYYVLVSVFQCVPLLHQLFNIAKRYNYSHSTDINNLNFFFNNQFSNKEKIGLKKNYIHSKRNNLKKNIHLSNFFEILKNRSCVTYLKKLIIFIILNRCYIHNENRKINFNCFILTLVHISIRFNTLNNVNKTLSNLINSLKSSQKGELYNNNYPLRKKKKKIKRNKNYFNNISNKYKKIFDSNINAEEYVGDLKNNKNKIYEKKTSKIKYDKHNFKGKSKKSQETCRVCSICHDILNKNCKKKNCKFCLKSKFNFLYDKKCDKELINILKNFIYYFMFYFLIFESKEKKISIFSMKLNISMRLGDILSFLIKLKLLKRNRHKNNVECINLTHFLSNKKKKKKFIMLNEIDHKEFLSECKMENSNSKTYSQKIYSNKDNIKNIKEKNNSKYKSIKKDNNKLINDRNTKMLFHDNIIKNKNNEYEKWKSKNKKPKNDNSKINKSKVNKNNFNKNENNKNEYNESETNNINQNEKNKKIIYKKNSVKNQSFNKFSKIFYLSFFEILSIFSNILNSRNLHLVNESCVDLYLYRLKKKIIKHKINKYRLKNNIIHYFMILKINREKNLLKYSNKTKYKVCNMASNNKRINKKHIYINHKRKNEININTTDKKGNSLGQLNWEPVSKNKNILNILDFSNSENIKGRNDTEKNLKYIEKKTSLMKNEQTPKNAYIKRKNEIKKKLYYFRKNIFSHKNYISILYYFNIYITPYELFLFFLKFVKIIKKKNKIKISFNDMLYFFIFYNLLYKSSILANKNVKY